MTFGDLLGVVGIVALAALGAGGLWYGRGGYRGRAIRRLVRPSPDAPAFARVGRVALLAHLQGLTARRILIGTWADAGWAIRFYQRHGYALVPPDQKAPLLRTYWTVSDRQIETSVVLAGPARD